MCLSGSAQSEKIVFRGQLLNKSNGSPIPYAHLIILNKNVGLSSNEDGTFAIRMDLNDSLRISAIGFKNFLFTPTDSIDLKKNYIIELQANVYELETVRITPYLSYAELRRAMVDYKYTDDEQNYIQLRKGLKGILKYNDVPISYKPGLGNPISLLYNAFGKHARYLRMVKRIKDDNKIQDGIDARFNPQIVSFITGMSDETEIRIFMDYCNFSTDYLKDVIDLELYRVVLLKYSEYLKEKVLN
jgi:hypothetical protein